MDLDALIHRGKPAPWTEGDNIPWNDPDFSERMLREHLTQEHDAASRRSATIDRHVAFIHEHLLGGRAVRVLDLGCGPGLYATRLARLGHSVRGVDFSPASIAYARRLAEEQQVQGSCVFDLSDVRAANFNSPEMGWDLVMFIYGEFNVFRPADAQSILARACQALKPGGLLLLEVSSEAATRRLGSDPAGWSAQESGLFSAQPHMLLTESFWDEDARAATHRFWVVDAGSGEVSRYAASYQVYSNDDFPPLLREAGFDEVRFYPSLTGEEEGGDFIAITARRR